MSLLDTRHKRKSFTLTTVLLSGLLILLFYIGLGYLDPPIENGIAIHFGTDAIGSSPSQVDEAVNTTVTPPVETAPPATKEAQIPEPEEQTPEAVEQVVTQDQEESLVIQQAEEAKRKAEEAQKKAAEEAARLKAEAEAEAKRLAEETAKKEAEAEAERIRQEQEAKKRALDALMGGLNNTNGNTSGDDDNGEGDKGQLDGDPYANSYYGNGANGNGFGLSGRSLASSNKFEQDCNERGRVVVEIQVDPSGAVVKATPGVKGSNNTAPCLLTAAEKTARSYKWNADPKAPARQIGFIVVNFDLQ